MKTKLENKIDQKVAEFKIELAKRMDESADRYEQRFAHNLEIYDDFLRDLFRDDCMDQEGK